MTSMEKLSFHAGLGTASRSDDMGVFQLGSVVQVISGSPGDDDARVISVGSATVRVGRDRIVAATDADEWAWLASDIIRVFHGAGEPWVIFDVPGVPDMGVSAHHQDAALFHNVIESALPHSVHVYRTTSRTGSHESTRPRSTVDLLTDTPDVGSSVASDWSELPVYGPDKQRDASMDETVVMSIPNRGHSLTSVPAAEWSVSPKSEPLTGDAYVQPSTAAPAKLEANGIAAWFGTHQVLDQVSLEMPSGQVTALIGPSGCGKSTFLRILNRMHELVPSASLAGEVLLDGVDLYHPSRRLTEARLQVGMVFQKPNPFPAMSIYDNVVAGFRLTGKRVSSAVKDQVVESCLSKAGLWNEVKDRLRSPGGSLSGGQQQRLCIARALAITPRVLLMDEPCSALDPTSTRRIEQTITELAREVTIVIVTHNMQQAARVSDLCAFFLAEQGTPGVIVEHGPTEAMFNRPQDPRTDDYVNGRFG